MSEAVAEEALGQLRRCLTDEGPARQYPSVRFTGLAVVFHGREMVRLEAVRTEPW